MHSPKQLCPRRVPRDQFGGTSRVCIRPARDSKQANLLRQSLETMGTPIDEVEIGASDKVANGLRRQHLATTRKSDYPCRDMDGDPLSVATAQFDLTRVQPASHFDAERAYRFYDGARTPDSPGRSIESRHKTIAESS